MSASATPTKDTMTTSVRMARDYNLYLRRLAERERCSMADVIDRSVAAYAREIKFDPPPRR